MNNEIFINTQLNQYCYLTSVTYINSQKIEGIYHFKNKPFFLLIESMAQIASLHYKINIQYKKKTFLLSIKNYSPWTHEIILNGVVAIKGNLLVSTEESFLYHVHTEFNSIIYQGDFLISSCDNASFERGFLI